MGLFGKKQTDDCEDLGEALAQTKPYYNDKE